MAKKRRKPLTEGGGRSLGGKATVRKYGPERIRRIGKAGFGRSPQARLHGRDGSRRIRWLQRREVPGDPGSRARQAMFEDSEAVRPDQNEPEEEDRSWRLGVDPVGTDAEGGGL